MIAIGLLFVRMLCDCFKPRQRALLIWLYRRSCPYRKLKTADRDRESADTRSR